MRTPVLKALRVALSSRSLPVGTAQSTSGHLQGGAIRRTARERRLRKRTASAFSGHSLPAFSPPKFISSLQMIAIAFLFITNALSLASFSCIVCSMRVVSAAAQRTPAQRTGTQARHTPTQSGTVGTSWSMPWHSDSCRRHRCPAKTDHAAAHAGPSVCRTAITDCGCVARKATHPPISNLHADATLGPKVVPEKNRAVHFAFEDHH